MRSARTDKVLNLLEKQPVREQPSNPMLTVPESEPIPVVFTKTAGGTQLINVVFLLINEQLLTVMERFNCCTCEECAAAVTMEVLEQIKPVYVTVKRKSDADGVNKTAAEYRSEVISAITKAVIKRKSSLSHGNFQKGIEK